MTATGNISTASNAADLAAVRKRVDQFVGLFFYGTLLKSAREHRLTQSKFGFGGRGEEAFGAQLDQELAQRTGGATHGKLNEAIFRQLTARMPGAAKLKLPADPAGGLAMSARRYSMPSPAGGRLDVKR